MIQCSEMFHEITTWSFAIQIQDYSLEILRIEKLNELENNLQNVEQNKCLKFSLLVFFDDLLSVSS